MLTFISLFLTFSALNAQPYTCPGGETYDDSTLVSCSDVVHGLPCTLDTDNDGTCTSFPTGVSQSTNVLICCPTTTDSSTDAPDATDIPTDTTTLPTEIPTETADTTCDDALTTCFSDCNDRSSSSSRNLLGRYHGHSHGSCCSDCREAWESCSGETYTADDNCGSSHSSGYGHGNGHGHGNGCGDEHDSDAYAGGSAALSYFVIPLVCIIFILCVCCICCKKTNKNNVEEVNMVSVVNNNNQKPKHQRVPSESINRNTSTVGESHETSNV